MFNKLLKTSVLIFISLFLVLPNSVFAGRAEGGQVDQFDIQPRTAGASETIRVTLGITLFGEEVRDYCGITTSTLYWEVYEETPAGKNYLPSSIGNASFGQFINGVSKDFSFSSTLSPVPAGATSRQFYATIYCQRYLGIDRKDISTSSPVVLAAGGGSGTGTCNNNGTCDAGETSATCRDCPIVPGATQSFQFSLDNPLEADNFLELIDVLATWLFNLSIPIVVVMIVYAGVMFLTSRGEPAKVTKARQILLYAVVGFAIILIGKGFITLIESILNLGANP
ncbi:MAG: hypothetical protein HYX22_00515 [Candidatus Yanofskybacteria bacterium]|nr:hypothetical protein [Candidatus Yanofskybacteria bacterium]